MNWVWCASCVGIGFGGHKRSVCLCGAKMMGGVHVGWGWCECCDFETLWVGGRCVGLKLGLRFVCVPSWMRGCRSWKCPGPVISVSVFELFRHVLPLFCHCFAILDGETVAKLIGNIRGVCMLTFCLTREFCVRMLMLTCCLTREFRVGVLSFDWGPGICVSRAFSAVAVTGCRGGPGTFLSLILAILFRPLCPLSIDEDAGTVRVKNNEREGGSCS